MIAGISCKLLLELTNGFVCAAVLSEHSACRIVLAAGAIVAHRLLDLICRFMQISTDTMSVRRPRSHAYHRLEAARQHRSHPVVRLYERRRRIEPILTQFLAELFGS